MAAVRESGRSADQTAATGGEKVVRRSAAEGAAAALAAAGRPGIGPAGLLALQRAVGNQAVARMVAGQERHEHGPSCGHQVQRSVVDQALTSAGRPLPGEVRKEMEGRLGADFSDVRVHHDGVADRAAESVQAHAFTTGSHIVFRSAAYDTGSASGKHMLAHELAHVVQQRSGPVAGTDNGSGLRVSDPSDRFEREAEATATRAMRGHAASSDTAGGLPDGSDRALAASDPAVQRMPVQRAFAHGSGKVHTDADLDTLITSGASKPLGLQAFKRCEAVCGPGSWGSDSDTTGFAHQDGSDLLERQQITWGKTKIGELAAGGEIKGGQYDGMVKMHLVNSFLHKGANSWAGNWVWGQHTLNSEHDDKIESRVKLLHPDKAHGVAALYYGVEVLQRAQPKGTAADLFAEIKAMISRALGDLPGFTMASDELIEDKVRIGGKKIADFHKEWAAAIARTTASQIKVQAFAYRKGADDRVEKEELGSPTVISHDSEVDYRAYLNPRMDGVRLTDLGVLNLPEQPSKRRRVAARG